MCACPRSLRRSAPRDFPGHHLTDVVDSSLFLSWLVRCYVRGRWNPDCDLPLRTDKVSLVGFGVLVYAILLFVYFYKITGGASSVAVVGGRYVSTYKDHVIRTVTEQEYRMFPICGPA